MKYLIEKEFKQMERDPIIPGLILFFPIMVLLIFPWAINFEVKNIRITVIDNCNSSYSNRLINKIGGSNHFILQGRQTNYNLALKNIEEGKSDMVLVIPSQFDSELVKKKTTSLGLSVNSVNGTQGLIGNNYLTAIVADLSSEIRRELTSKEVIGNMGIENKSIENMGIENEHSGMEYSVVPRLSRIDIVPQYKFNPELDYKTYMLPAFMVILLTLIGGILPALNIVSEKETGTIYQINVTPVRKIVFILSKLVPYWIIGIIITLISVAAIFFIYRLWPASNFLLVLLSSFIFIFSISGMGIIISNYSETLQQATFLVIFFILIIMLLSGMFTPISSMPHWAQLIAYANPLTYFTRVLRMLYLNGSTLGDIIPYLLILFGFAAVLFGWAVLSYKKRK